MLILQPSSAPIPAPLLGEEQRAGQGEGLGSGRSWVAEDVLE